MKQKLRSLRETRLAEGGISLRKLEPGDCAQIVRISVYDGKFARDEAEARGIAQRIEGDFEKGDSIHWAIWDEDEGAIVGTIGFYRGFVDLRGELGYIIKREYRKRNYCTKAIRCASACGFSGLGLREIVANTGIGNAGSRRALEKNGFVVRSAEGEELRYSLGSGEPPGK